MSNFAQIFSAPDRMPGFWSGPLGTAYRYALGGTLDQFLQIHWQRLRAAWPSYATDASIGELGRDRRVLLFEGQGRASKEAMLKRWRSAHRQAGLPSGIMRMGRELWLPEVPTIRVVAGNSTRAMWATLYGDDDTATNEIATDDELNDDRTILLTDANGKTYDFPAGRKPRFYRSDPSNWDWDSGYFSEVMATEPPTVHRCFVIVYKPASIDFHPEEPDPDAGISLNSTMTVQAVQNVIDCANYWSRAGAVLWGWVLAGDPESFQPEGSGVGYPDGSWWHSPNRLDTARYEMLHSATEIV